MTGVPRGPAGVGAGLSSRRYGGDGPAREQHRNSGAGRELPFQAAIHRIPFSWGGEAQCGRLGQYCD